MTQSGLSCIRDMPHIHLPPSPSAPNLSSSWGQLNIGGKKSPVSVHPCASAERRLRGCSGALTDCVCRPGILVWGEPGTGEVSGEYSRAKRGQGDVHDYLCWCWTKPCDKVVALGEHIAVLALFALYSRLEVMICVVSNGAKRWC